MDNKFIEGLKEETNVVITENGAPAYRTTNSDLLDLFATIGGLRIRHRDEIEQKFAKAFAEDPLLAMKILFYARNIRGGLGERETPRTIFKYMAIYHKEIMQKNMHLVPLFDRWDDLYSFIDIPLENDAFLILKDQIVLDSEHAVAGKDISLCAKWLKSAEGVSRERWGCEV